MRASLAAFAILAAGCGQPQTPLTCPCPDLQETLRTSCGDRDTTVHIARADGYQEVVLRQGGHSYVGTLQILYYDATGKLVGRKLSVNEHNRRTVEGLEPDVTWGPSIDGCAVR